MSLHVLIAGGGIGGLCLAQGLRQSGIRFDVYERDVTFDARGQGYRFRINSDGDTALLECLPANLYDLYQATSNQPSCPPAGTYDAHLNLIYRFPTPPNTSNSGPGKQGTHVAVNRRTLRQVLLGGLEEVVHFDRTLTGFQQDGDGVRIQFSDGSTASGDMLVAADGIHSAIRRQMLPHASLMDTDMRCVYGTTRLNDEMLEGMPEPLFSGFTPVIGPDRSTLAMGMFRPCRPFVEAVAEYAPTIRLDAVPPYLMWMFVTPKDENHQQCESSQTVESLHAFVLERLQDWHPDLRRLVELADVPSIFPISIRSSRPVPPWTPGRVSLLGDAIHAMTPAGGIGANTAMRDAALLTNRLAGVDRGESGLLEAVAAYEAAMRDYAFAAVQRSLVAASQLYRITFLDGEGFS